MILAPHLFLSFITASSLSAAQVNASDSSTTGNSDPAESSAAKDASKGTTHAERSKQDEKTLKKMRAAKRGHAEDAEHHELEKERRE